MMFDEKYYHLYSNLELLTFATTDKNRSLDDFGLYMPMKPKIEYEFKVIK